MNNPNPVPAASARPTIPGRTRPCVPPGPALTRPIAATAQPAPIVGPTPGVPSTTTPIVNGMSAEVTAVTGATIVIAPVASPRYSRITPAMPNRPASAPQASPAPVGWPGANVSARTRTGRPAGLEST